MHTTFKDHTLILMLLMLSKVIQKRFKEYDIGDGSCNFGKSNEDYNDGFGNPTSPGKVFWLGKRISTNFSLRNHYLVILRNLYIKL